MEIHAPKAGCAAHNLAHKVGGPHCKSSRFAVEFNDPSETVARLPILTFGLALGGDQKEFARAYFRPHLLR